MESRVLATDCQKDIAHCFAAGHNFLVAAGELAQDGRDMNGNNWKLGKHDDPPPEWY
jgi:hypothetical protein